MVGICMIKVQNHPSNAIVFSAKRTDKETSADETRILPNTARTRTKQRFQKTSSAFLDYPAKGLKGDVNSSFYEFLTMGIIPYLAGSAMFMVVFNAANKHLHLLERENASVFGKKMALGVVMYGLLKTISKSFVTKPVKMFTGVDIEMPYENIVYPLPKKAGEDANIEIQHQQRKVFDSKEFYRKDLLNREYYDGIARKLNMGEDLNDSVSETNPIIQNIVATTNTAKSLSSYCWAGVGVGMAVQDNWVDFFNKITARDKFVPDKNAGFMKNLGGRCKNILKNSWNISVSFVKNFFKSFAQMWKGKDGSWFRKYAGKGFIGFTALLTAILTTNAIKRAKNMAKNKNINTIDTNKDTTVI